MVRFFGPTLYKVVGNLHRIEAETKQQIKATWQLTNSVLAYVSRESERVPCDRIAPPPEKSPVGDILPWKCLPAAGEGLLAQM